MKGSLPAVSAWPQNISRYLRLYGHFARFSFMKALQFRVDFWSRILVDTFYYATGLTFFRVLYLHTSTLGGWDENQALIFISSFFLIDALHMALLSPNMHFLSQYIREGLLDYYLVRPVSSFFLPLLP